MQYLMTVWAAVATHRSHLPPVMQRYHHYHTPRHLHSCTDGLPTFVCARTRPPPPPRTGLLYGLTALFSRTPVCHCAWPGSASYFCWRAACRHAYIRMTYIAVAWGVASLPVPCPCDTTLIPAATPPHTPPRPHRVLLCVVVGNVVLCCGDTGPVYSTPLPHALTCLPRGLGRMQF